MTLLALSRQLAVPRWPFALNTDAPLSKGIVAWYPVIPGDGNILRDLSGRGQHMTAGVAETYTAVGTELGVLGLNCPAVTTGLSTTAAALVALPTSENFSVGLWAWKSVFGNPNAALSFSGTDDLIIYPFDAVGGNGPLVFWRDLGGTGFINLNTEPYPAAKPVRLLFTSVGGNDHRLYANGKQVGSSAATGVEGPFTSVQVGHFDNVQDFVDIVWNICFWNRALSAAEAWRDFSPATRWDLYHELGRRLYFVPAAAGGFQPAWARVASRTAVIGAGAY